MPLTSLVPGKLGEYDFSPFATKPKTGKLETNQQLIEKEQRRKMALVKASYTRPEPTPAKKPPVKGPPKPSLMDVLGERINQQRPMTRDDVGTPNDNDSDPWED